MPYLNVKPDPDPFRTAMLDIVVPSFTAAGKFLVQAQDFLNFPTEYGGGAAMYLDARTADGAIPRILPDDVDELTACYNALGDLIGEAVAQGGFARLGGYKMQQIQIVFGHVTGTYSSNDLFVINLSVELNAQQLMDAREEDTPVTLKRAADQLATRFGVGAVGEAAAKQMPDSAITVADTR